MSCAFLFPGSSNEEAAEQEEIEAMALQKRMAAALREDDFEVAQLDNDTIPTINKSDKKQTNTNLVSCVIQFVFYNLCHQEIVTRDLTKLSKDDKLEVIQICCYRWYPFSLSACVLDSS